MNLDYYTLLCPVPINIGIGRIQNHTLLDIGKITYLKYGMFQVYLKLTPSDYYKNINKERGETYWELLSDEQKQAVTLYDLILTEEDVKMTYMEMFNFFFVERVIFRENLFYVLKDANDGIADEDVDINEDTIQGIIYPHNISEVIDVIEQVCCIKSDDPLDEPTPKFKNEKAKRLYERMLEAKKRSDEKKIKKNSVNMSLPNIISAVAAKSFGLNVLNIWDITVFQLFDQFNKIQFGDSYYINSVRVAVWGDENNQFDQSLWYKNTFTKTQI